MQIYEVLMVKSAKNSNLKTPSWYIISGNLKIYVVKRWFLDQLFEGYAVFRRDFHQLS